jgi:hypothetical protein
MLFIPQLPMAAYSQSVMSSSFAAAGIEQQQQTQTAPQSQADAVPAGERCWGFHDRL